MAILLKSPGNTGPVNAGEQRLLDFLFKNLPDEYYLIPNLDLPNRNPRNGATESLELDCVVVAPHAIYHLENKDWSGRIAGNDTGGWYINGAWRKNPYPGAVLKSKILASKLKEVDAGWGKAWCTAAIVISSSVVLDLDGDSEVHQLNSALINYLTDPARAKSYTGKITNIQADIAQWLSGLSGAPKVQPKIFEDQYEIKEILEQTEAYTEFLAQPRGGHSQARKRIREFAMDIAGISPEEKKHRLDRIKNQYNAVQQIGFSPYILQCQLITDIERGYLYEISEYMEESSLLSQLGRKTFTLREKVDIIRNVAKALEAAHLASVFHRDVSPENIYLISGGFAMLGNFARSFYLGTEKREYTAMPSLRDEDLTPYMPWELKDGDAGAYTDVYALGVTAYTILMGKTPIKDCYDLDHKGGKLPDNLLPSNVDKSLPDWMDELMLKTIRTESEDRFASTTELLDLISKHESSAVSSIEPTSTTTDPSGEIHVGMREGAYVFMEKIGDGGYSEVWRVRHSLQSEEYAMKVYQPSVNVDSVITEFNALRSIEHQNIVKVVWNDRMTGNGRCYTLMELLKGETLSDYAYKDKNLSLPLVFQAAQELLGALAYLHERVQPTLHRDIKPKNIMWDQSKRFVLIDFNVAAIDAGDKKDVGTSPYQAPDRFAADHKVTWDESCDTFALGITLYELICKKHPYKKRQPMEQRDPDDPLISRPEISQDFANWLLQSVQPRRDDRFITASAMLESLNKIGINGLLERTKISNKALSGGTEAFVIQLNRLYSQSNRSNAGTRGLDKFAISTYIDTRLDTKLKDAILQGRYRLVIITGNAGDGKTAFIQKVEKDAQKLFSESFNQLPTKNGATFTINGVPFQSNWDGSQNEKEKSNHTVLDEFFSPFANVENFSTVPAGRLIAINEGRLTEYLEDPANRLRFNLLNRSVDEFFNSDYTSGLPDGLLLVNLNVRSVVGDELGGESIFRKQLKKFLEPENWSSCASCSHRERCFIRFNVESLSNPALGESVIGRMESLLHTVHLRRERHITMRDLRSMLAFWLTRDHTCQEAMALSDQQNPLGVVEKMYFNLPEIHAKDSGNDDLLVSLIRQTDTSLNTMPAEDRALFFRELQLTNFLPVTSDRKLDILALFNRLKRDTSREDDLEPLRRLQRMLSRFHYFEGLSERSVKRNPYRAVDKFQSFFHQPINQDPETQGQTQIEIRQKLKLQIARAIGLLEGCHHSLAIAKNIVLAAGQRDPFCASYRLFPLTDFELEEDKRPDLMREYMEYLPDKLIFRHQDDPKIALTISLDIYEMLWHIEKGYLPSLEELKGRFIELSVFKNKLANRTYREVLVTEDNSTFYRIYADSNNHILIEPINESSWQ
jgi:serine/threonine protein kinase